MSHITIKTLEFKNDKLVLLDQRLLPNEEIYNTYEDYLSVAKAIENLVVRGAPAIGVAAAFGVVLGAYGLAPKTFEEFYQKLEVICDRLAATRPTAVNLFWAIARMKNKAAGLKDFALDQVKQKLKEEAMAIYHEDIENNRQMGKQGSALLKDGMTILTHCNAGALATAGFGTALGVIYTAVNEGKRIHVFADETRPVLQGARLTAWELQKYGIEVTVICDNMAASLMRDKRIDAVIVGADRIAANGDVVNKIGTYNCALLAKYHQVPFYVAAPLSTIDLNVASADEITIEQRDPAEISVIHEKAITPSHVGIYNPAFDKTPANLVSAIISEKGIAENPFAETLAAWKKV